jgi:hypothetical protein
MIDIARNGKHVPRNLAMFDKASSRDRGLLERTGVRSIARRYGDRLKAVDGRPILGSSRMPLIRREERYAMLVVRRRQSSNEPILR